MDIRFEQIAEGVCPFHLTQLDPRDPDYGWCDECRCGWSVRWRTDGELEVFMHTIGGLWPRTPNLPTTGADLHLLSTGLEMPR